MTAPRTPLAEGLAGRYRIERELGRGGMATVYLAHDERHDRPVALKVLHPELAHAVGPERFQREIKLAARLQHPHILTVHDSGETAGQLWFTMPFIEGESLRDRLSREKQLPLEDALRIAREAADALEYAHQHGVVHRDIKPENILLSGQHALLADFGIARALGSGANDQHLTETGTSIGTAAYMSPEQAAGERDVDARSDLYSLATVLYEMLGGQTPFTAATPQQMIARRFTETPRPLTDVRGSVPASIAHAVQKALATTPADRYGSAAEFARALAPAEATATAPAAVVARPRRRMPVAFATLILGFAIGLGVLFAWRKDHGSDGDGPRRLAVLPFENQGAAADDYFADGLTEEVRGKLTALPGLAVTASASSGQYRKSTKSLSEIAAELGVDYLLVAKVRWEKHADGTSRVRVSPELIDARTGTAKWQEPFEAAITGVFQVQSDIASQVAGKLDVALTDSIRTRLEARPTQNVAAYDAYLRGSMSGLDPATIRTNVAALEQAVALDPSFARAWARLAGQYAALYAMSVPTRQLAHSARRALDRAFALTPNDASPYFAAVTYYTTVDVEPDSVQAAIDQMFRISPNDPRVLSYKANTAMSRGAFDSALVHIDGAIARDPRIAGRWGIKTQLLLYLGRYAEARTAGDRTVQLAPGDVSYVQRRARAELLMGDLAAARDVLRRSTANPADLAAYMSVYEDLYWVLPDADQDLVLRLPGAAFDDDRATWGTVRAQIYALRGDAPRMRIYADSALAAYDEQLRESPDDAQLHALRGLVLALVGRKAESIEEGERGMALVPASRRVDVGLYCEHQLARIYILTGEPEKAIDLIERLLKAGYFISPGLLRIDPNFAPLRDNPRFQRLAKG